MNLPFLKASLIFPLKRREGRSFQKTDTKSECQPYRQWQRRQLAGASRLARTDRD